MPLSSRIKLAAVSWIILEIVAFSLVAHWIGVPRTILLGVITSLLGLTLLRRAGTSALLKLRSSFEGKALGAGDGTRFLDEMLATGGALALLLPGFLSDILGLALAAPVVRDRAARWIGGGGPAWVRGRYPKPGPTTIDLEPDQWRQTDASTRPLGKTGSS